MNIADGKLNIYVDMDGVLANFDAEPDGVKRFRFERYFFKRLKPLEKNVKALRKLIADGKHNVFILSASPNDYADNDKRLWLHTYVPEMSDGNMIFMRNGEKKVDYMRTADGILFDDYSKNINEWVESDGNRAVKIRADGDIQNGLIALQFLTDIILNG